VLDPRRVAAIRLDQVQAALTSRDEDALQCRRVDDVVEVDVVGSARQLDHPRAGGNISVVLSGATPRQHEEDHDEQRADGYPMASSWHSFLLYGAVPMNPSGRRGGEAAGGGECRRGPPPSALTGNTPVDGRWMASKSTSGKRRSNQRLHSATATSARMTPSLRAATAMRV
jgi:hypothetical protein